MGVTGTETFAGVEKCRRCFSKSVEGVAQEDANTTVVRKY